jgi:hypothetical protein
MWRESAVRKITPISRPCNRYSEKKWLWNICAESISCAAASRGAWEDGLAKKKQQHRTE